MNKCQFKKYLEEANAYFCILSKKYNIKKKEKKIKDFIKNKNC